MVYETRKEAKDGATREAFALTKRDVEQMKATLAKAFAPKARKTSKKAKTPVYVRGTAGTVGR